MKQEINFSLFKEFQYNSFLYGSVGLSTSGLSLRFRTRQTCNISCEQHTSDLIYTVEPLYFLIPMVTRNNWTTDGLELAQNEIS
jgi:hypothetical protein